MTFEKLYSMTLGDIRSLRFTCTKCGAIVTMPIASKYPPAGCPLCPDQPQWFDIHGGEYAELMKFITSIKTLKQRGEKAACSIRLEIEKKEGLE